MSFSDWSTVDSENDTTSGINIAENCPAANVNNWGRRIMAQLRAAFNPILDTFFASTTLSQARTALGVPEGSTSLTNFSGLTNAANTLPYMTGSDAWATTSLTSFARTLLDDGDAATALATLGALGGSVTTTGSGSSLNITIGGVTYRVQFATGTGQSSEGTQSITWPVAFGTACLGATVGTRIASGSSSADSMYQLVGSPTTTTATVYLQVLDGNAVSHTPTIIGFGY